MNVNIRLHQFKKAIDNLDNVIQESKSDIVRDALSQYLIVYRHYPLSMSQTK
jgi:metal-responsive CopG/Arc/MetJ family transcriptional regulator